MDQDSGSDPPPAGRDVGEGVRPPDTTDSRRFAMELSHAKEIKGRAMVVVLAAVLLVSFSGIVFAQSASLGPNDIFQQKFGATKDMTFQGTVLSHDVACHCVVVKIGETTLTLQDDYTSFKGDYDRAKGLEIGSTIKGAYRTVDYINYATHIETA